MASIKPSLSNDLNNDALISASQNRNMFNIISNRYDLLNKCISLGLDMYWRKKSITCLNPIPEGKYLDIGCGTGDLSILLGQCSRSIRVAGCDPSVKMIRVAQKKIKKIGLKGQIKFQIGDGLDLPYAKETFNGVVMGFCIRNVTNHKKVLQETLRVLKPNSRCIILELSKPERKLISIFYKFHTQIFVPFVANALSKQSAYNYLNNSIKAFPKTTQFKDLMRNVGFVNCSTIQLSLGVVTIFIGEKKFS